MEDPHSEIDQQDADSQKSLLPPTIYLKAQSSLSENGFYSVHSESFSEGTMDSFELLLLLIVLVEE